MKRYLYILCLVLTSFLLPDRLCAVSAADVSQLDYALYASDASAMAGRQMVLTLFVIESSKTLRQLTPAGTSSSVPKRTLLTSLFMVEQSPISGTLQYYRLLSSC